MKNKLAISFLSSGLQAVAVQIFGVAFFYLISIYASKEDFGIIGWANAMSMFVVTLLSCGMEQVVVRRIASSKSSDWTAAAFFFHALFGSLAFLALLFAATFFLHAGDSLYRLLPLFFLAQAFTFVAVPLKQFLNAKEIYTPYAIIAFVSNLSKILLLGFAVFVHALSLNAIVYILIGCACFELSALLVYILFVSSVPFSFSVKATAYRKLLKESLPQYLAVIFDSSLSRIDWILLGFLSTNIVTADYSFAYRAYEVARLPLTIIGPIILAKYSRLLVSNNLDAQKVAETRRFLSIELFGAVLVIIVLNILWSPAVDSLTHGKYGSANANVFLIISLCLPLHCISNLFWTLGFAARRYKQIARITMVVAIVNLILNLALIPLIGAMGAATSYLLATIIQVILYTRLVNSSILTLSLRPLVVFVLLGIASYCVGRFIADNMFIQIITAAGLYLFFSVLLKLVGKSDLQIIKGYLKK